MKGKMRKRGALLLQGIGLAAAALVLALLLYLRAGNQFGAASPPEPSPTLAVTSLPTTAPPTVPPEATSEPEPTATPEPTPLPPPPEKLRDVSYNERTYKLVSDMVFTYRYLQEGGLSEVRRLVEELKENDALLGRTWEGIMDYWAYVNDGLEVNLGQLPDGLPQDDSLAIVVLGFELNADGTMAPELEQRCDAALAAAEKYPRAWLLLTGGKTSTAEGAPSEAEAMARYLKDKGLDESRLILEEQSKTTSDNAVNSCRILAERYPQVESLAIVTSDYHMQLGCLLFTEAALLYAHEHDVLPYAVEANAAIDAPDRPDYQGTYKQFLYLWAMADPKY